MSVQRWTMQHLVGKVGLTLDADSNGEWVTYSDHARIVAEMEQAHEAALVADQVNTHGFIESVAKHEAMLAEAKALLASREEAWDEGYAAGLAAAAPRTLTADDPEPAVGSVVLFDGLPYIRQGNKWVAPRANIAYWYEFMRDERPTVLIHDGGAA